MGKITTTQQDSWTWAASNSGISQNIEKIGLITRLLFTVEIIPSATLTAANQPDGLFRPLQNLVIKGDGVTFIELPGDAGGGGGTLLHYMGQMDGFGYGHRAGAIAAPQTLYTSVNFPIHIGSRPKDIYGRDNPYDLSAFIPAFNMGSLVGIWTTQANDVLDDTVTLSSAVMYLTISRVEDSDEGIVAEMGRQGIVLPKASDMNIRGMVPSWIQRQHPNAAATTSFAGEVEDVPGGGFLKRISMLFQDATATRPVRATDEVTEAALYYSADSRQLFAHHAEVEYSSRLLGSNLKLGDTVGASVDNSVDFNAQSPHGLMFFDLRTQANHPVGKDYGLDLRPPYVTGQLKLGFIIGIFASGDDTLIIWERYQPYAGRLGR